MKAADREVFDEEAAAEQADRQTADADLAIDLPRRSPLGELAHTRAEVDRQRRHDHDSDDRRRDREAHADVPQKLADERTLQDAH